MEKTVCELFAGVGGFRCGLNHIDSLSNKANLTIYSHLRQSAHKLKRREDNIPPNTSAIERLHIIEILINYVRIKLDGDVEKNHPKDSDYTWI